MQSSSFQLVRRCFSYKMPPNQPDEFVKDAGSREIEFSAILPALQFPQKAEKSCFSCYDNEKKLLFLHELGQLCAFPFWSGSFRQSHIKQSGCLMDSFKQKSPLL